MNLLNIMVLLSIKNQAGLAQDPWPQAKTKPVRPRTLGQPSRSGPGPLAPQAKTKPVRPRTLGPQAKTKPVRPRTLGPQAKPKPVRPRTLGLLYCITTREQCP